MDVLVIVDYTNCEKSFWWLNCRQCVFYAVNTSIIIFLFIYFRANDIKHVKNFMNPIITITEHSGVTSPDINFYRVYKYFLNFCLKWKYTNIICRLIIILLQAQFFDDYQFDNVFSQGQKLSKDYRHSNLTRSQTDSNITYISEEIAEVEGSLNFITRDGDINMEVVLRVLIKLLI